MLNGIVQNRTVLTFELHTYAKLNCLKWNCFVCQTELFEIEQFWHSSVCKLKTILILNWILWNKTVWLNWIAWNRNVFDD